MHIHILGVGNLGRYIAYSLVRGADRPKVTLLFHKKELHREWKKSEGTIQMIQCQMLARPGFENKPLNHFKVEDIPYPGPRAPPIKHLIVTTKAPATAGAVHSIKGRLSKDSQILFVHNGLGAIDEVTDKVFPDPKTRPYYWAGVCEAGIYGHGPFQVVKAGEGPLVFGHSGARSCEVPDDRDNSFDLDFLHTLLATHPLDARLERPERLVYKQLRKLVVNSVINPLTAMYRCKNGEAFTRKEGQQLRDALVEEAGAVVRALLATRDDVAVKADFWGDGLRNYVEQIAYLTRENKSSMLQDIEAGRKTEIDYINGYLVRQAKRLRLPCEHHERIVQQIKELEANDAL
ncbi:ketopantoate reductase PanE/ApbA C terminal-domain-containing protein [Achaetomium macrosporum]|uniref:2-dehydropantoate 2-reductase n=1 Tax=Achaetomium macrosporum TaxID=79813 RepID=A0AAN7C1E1_9PEZI|nr:ketopantoate reductase PanE/ApbA C terminal-domain-containing protein [Achaetomium macrosporum]